MEVGNIISTVIPILMNIVYLIVGLGATVGLGYYLLVVRQRKVWKCNIWELRKVGNKISVHRTTKDKLVGRKFNKGKQIAYIFKRSRVETVPPSYECVDVINGKEEANYLKILDDYIPFRKNIELPDSFYDYEIDKVGKKQNKFLKHFIKSIADIKNMTASESVNKYIYVPLDKKISGALNFQPLDYDVNMMRINAIDNRDKIFKDKETWLQKYGTFLAIGMIVVLIIVVLYFSYDYSSQVISQGFSAADKVAKPLESLVDKLTGN